MFKHTVTYTDFNDVKHTEELCFNLFTQEMADLQFNPMVEDDMGKFIEQAMKTGEGKKLYILFKLLIINSYGRRSADGSQLLKRPEWSEEFINGPACEKFFEWVLLEDPSSLRAQQFYKGIMPARFLAGLDELENSDTKKKPKDMSVEELQAAYLKALESKKQSGE